MLTNNNFILVRPYFNRPLYFINKSGYDQWYIYIIISTIITINISTLNNTVYISLNPLEQLSLEQLSLKFFNFFWILTQILSYLAKALSLGLRLTANMIGGHVLLKIFSTFTWKAVLGGGLITLISVIPFAFIIAFTGLEIAIAFIQSYVFCMLTASYLNDAINLH